MTEGSAVQAKICGLSTPEAVAAAIEGGAAYVGFVFYPRSPRHVDPETVAKLCEAVPEGVTRVGLFVDADDATIERVLARAPLDMLQFHGSEPPARVAEARQRFRRKVMKVLSIAEPADVAAAEPYLAVADMLLFDARPPRRDGALPGGNGLAFDWRLIAGRQWTLPWMLSGGLTAATLAEAVRLTRAPSVDVSSGVESAPGVKDPAKIREFLAVARSLRVGAA
jgi:phosphoribosylanthranilate isomerase